MSARSYDNLPSSIRDFLAELEDLLEALGNDLVSLEDLVGTGGEDPDLINSLFRSFHTIKGLAGMLSLADVGTLAHALEDLLDAARLGKIELNEDLIELLSKGAEILNGHAKAIASGGKPPAQASFLKRVAKAMEASHEATPENLAQRIGLDEEVIKALTEYEEHRLRENIAAGKRLYLVHKSFALTDFDRELNDLVLLLKKEGEVISTLPSAAAEDPSRIRFDLLWATPLDAAGVSAKLPIGPKELTAVECEGTAKGGEKEVSTASLRSLSETVRVDIKRLNNLMNIVGELVIYKSYLGEISRDIAAREGNTASAINLGKAVKSLDRTLNFLQQGVIEARMVPIGQMFSKLHRVVRKLAGELGKEVDLRITGEDTELDKLVIEDMADPLLHLIRNAIDHGIERPDVRAAAGKPRRGTVSLSASQRGSHIVIEIEDDGGGIDVERVRQLAEAKGLLEKGLPYEAQQILAVLFNPGFTTTDKVTEVSGRGVGLDIVKNNVTRLRGMIDLRSAKGAGTEVTITLPMTLAIIQALMVRVGEETFAIPISSVLESVKIGAGEIIKVENKEVVRLRDAILPLLRLGQYFRLPQAAAKPSGNIYVVIVGLAEKRVGLVVDSLRGQQEIVIKPLGEMLKNVRGIAGATELGTRKAVLVVDVGQLIQEVTHAV